MKCGTHFELKLQLALWLPFTCFCVLLLAVSARFGLLLLAIGGCAFRSIATQVSIMLALLGALGRSWASLGRSWAPLGRLLASLGVSWRLLAALFFDFWWFWKGFGEDFGRFFQ